MTRPAEATRPRRWMFGIAVLLAALLVVSTGSLWLQIRGAARAVAGAQGAFLLRELTRRGTQPLPDQAALDSALATYRSEGLRWVGLVTDEGTVRLQAGPPSQRLDPALLGPPGPVPVVGALQFAAGPPPPLAPAPPSDPSQAPGAVPRSALPHAERLRPVVAYEAVLASDLDRGAGWTLALTLAAALGLVAAARHQLHQALAADARAEAEARRDRLASLGEMSAVLAHEIRNPLAALKGHAQLLLETTRDGERQHRAAERVVRSARRLEGITNGLLDFVRLSGVARVEVDPLSLVRAEADEAATPVRLDARGAPPTWSLDPDRFRQVLGNLLRNASEAHPEGPIEVVVTARGGRLVVSVQDHGPGLPPELGDRVFEPFRTTRARGTGLGLAVSRQIAELHGGTLTGGNHGGGARFVLEIPSA